MYRIPIVVRPMMYTYREHQIVDNIPAEGRLKLAGLLAIILCSIIVLGIISCHWWQIKEFFEKKFNK